MSHGTQSLIASELKRFQQRIDDAENLEVRNWICHPVCVPGAKRSKLDSIASVGGKYMTSSAIV